MGLLSYLIRVGYVDSWHIEASAVETWTLAQLLYDLHHDPLQQRKENWKQKQKLLLNDLQKLTLIADFGDKLAKLRYL